MKQSYGTESQEYPGAFQIESIHKYGVMHIVLPL